MKKGKINLLSFEDEEDDSIELEIHKKSAHPKKTQLIPEQGRPTLDLSQIKDRVSQMELDEELVLEGEAAEALINQQAEGEDEELLEKIKMAKLQRNNNKKTADTDELSDYIPITSKSEYWLNRDTFESEEAFKASSRLVREDLFNEIEEFDPSNAYTNFMNKERTGLMMTKKILERDIKTDGYDLELELEASEGNNEETEEDLLWRRGQVLKGTEKGWSRPAQNDTNFYSKQAKLATFIPPKPFEFIETTMEKDIATVDTQTQLENIEKISRDSERLEERIRELKEEMQSLNAKVKESIELETFFLRYSRFLSVKLPELREIQETGEKTRWEHFFDDVDVEDGDLLDLPDIITRYSHSNFNVNSHVLKEISELFIRYHFMFIIDEDNVEKVWESSGLKYALNNLEPERLEAIFKEIYHENELDKYEKIKQSNILKQ